MSIEDLGGLDFGNMNFDDNQTYAGSFFSTYNGKTCTVDTYRSEDGSLTDYYFLNGKWVTVTDHSAKPEESMQIKDFKAGVNESYIGLKGMIKFDSDNLPK